MERGDELRGMTKGFVEMKSAGEIKRNGKFGDFLATQF